jgi:hypothetical protein
MNKKGMLFGGAVGLLVLLLLGGFWWLARAPEPHTSLVSETAPGATTTPGVAAPAGAAAAPSGAAEPIASVSPGATAADPLSSSAGAGASATPSASSTATAPWNAAPGDTVVTDNKTPLALDERRKIRAEVRVKMTELLAKGQNVTPAETQAFLNDVEKLGQGMFDARYFSTMRQMVSNGARAQELAKELGKIAYSKAPKDMARQQDILAEMRDISDRTSNGAAALQAYAQATLEGKKP